MMIERFSRWARTTNVAAGHPVTFRRFIEALAAVVVMQFTHAGRAVGGHRASRQFNQVITNVAMRAADRRIAAVSLD